MIACPSAVQNSAPQSRIPPINYRLPGMCFAIGSIVNKALGLNFLFQKSYGFASSKMEINSTSVPVHQSNEIEQ